MAIEVQHEAGRVAEAVARESYGRLVAFLASRTRDVAGAEDALAEAFAAALRDWPRQGAPHNPDAWLLTVARRRQIDAARRRQTQRDGEGHVRLVAEELSEAQMSEDDIPDRRLGLMFACAHPAIEKGMRAPLILQTILGLTAEHIASAFIIPPAAMGQRLVRAKARIKDTGIPFHVPEKAELPDRLQAVLDAVYAAYTKGWNEIGEGGTPELAQEAIWLGRLIVGLVPDAPEAKGMLALMLYSEARRSARRDARGAFVSLEEQETGLWNLQMIDEAEALLHAANADGPSGRYQIEAAIQSAHVARRLTGRDTWPSVLALYEHLLALTQSPVVALNRAVAVAEVEGLRAAFAALDAIAGDKRMAEYQPYWAARGQICAQLDMMEEAHEAFSLAMGLSSDPAVRGYLRGRLRGLARG
ncbi:RNA polymerase subunit sigma-70 [Phyllobacterium sp. LjRoot231]|uniref:RNA polymerase sigma factor n=1 Tax=Phyllobacterium sp. LjRoot231 TaxID=3342289 RepID=UPI003ED10495